MAKKADMENRHEQQSTTVISNPKNLLALSLHGNHTGNR